MKKVKREELMLLVKGQTIVDIDAPTNGMLVIELANGHLMVLNAGNKSGSEPTGVAMFKTRAEFDRTVARAMSKQSKMFEQMTEAIKKVIAKHDPNAQFEVIGPIPVNKGDGDGDQDSGDEQSTRADLLRLFNSLPGKSGSEEIN